MILCVREYLCLLLLGDVEKYLDISEPIPQFQSCEDYRCIQKIFKHLKDYDESKTPVSRLYTFDFSPIQTDMVLS